MNPATFIRNARNAWINAGRWIVYDGLDPSKGLPIGAGGWGLSL